MSVVPAYATMDVQTLKVAIHASVFKDIATYLTTSAWVS